MGEQAISFREAFLALTGFQPMRWQERLYDDYISKGLFPNALDVPTGLGKTSVMTIWLIARALANDEVLRRIPRRLVYVVDRRAVVDQATEEAKKLLEALRDDAKDLRKLLGLGEEALPISTLRGQHADNRQWLADPASPAIIVGTVDVIGSRLLFGGYGVSRKMRPYHAGLLGADALVVLDEAHLVPPFAHLLAAIEDGNGLRPDDQGPIPRFRLLPLSATQRNRSGIEGKTCQPFSLEDNDISHDDVAAGRYHASKILRLEPAVEKDWDGAFASKAWELATSDNRCSRVVVFCNRRDKVDKEMGGPSVLGVLDTLQKLANGTRKSSVAEPLFEYEILVGGRRVRERQHAADKLKELGFVGRSDPFDRPAKPTFLLATSAGEVGVDFDADHMVSDLAPWERMVQRLGRVNRRGGKTREAEITVFDSSELEKDESLKERLKKTLGLLHRIGNGGQLNSGSLIELREKVGEAAIEDASTAEPLRPALTRALVDAWSMTSLETHTGRPEIAPWLRGWVEEKPQTTVIWRAHLPVRIDEEGRQFVPREDANDFFEAAPPHGSEKLESETFRVVEWLEERAREMMRSDKSDIDTAVDDNPLSAKDVAAITLSPAGEFERYFTLGELARERKGRERDEFFGRLIERMFVVDARFRGLTNAGMLNAESTDVPEAADSTESWSKPAGFRVRRLISPDSVTAVRYGRESGWRPDDEFVVRVNADGAALQILIAEHPRDLANSEDGRSVSVPQGLAEHEEWAEKRGRLVGASVGLSGIALEVLALSARLHDEGKRADRWQRAFGANRDITAALKQPLAKTRGPIDQKVLDGYRHEFGSLAVFDRDHAWHKGLPDDVKQRIDKLEDQPEWFDLLRHLIASHHGGARPVISTRSCEEAPPSSLDGRARDVALRFVRLQKKWGPWGLAWWEALLRAADQQASRENDNRSRFAEHGSAASASPAGNA